MPEMRMLELLRMVAERQARWFSEALVLVTHCCPKAPYDERHKAAVQIVEMLEKVWRDA